MKKQRGQTARRKNKKTVLTNGRLVGGKLRLEVWIQPDFDQSSTF